MDWLSIHELFQWVSSQPMCSTSNSTNHSYILKSICPKQNCELIWDASRKELPNKMIYRQKEGL
jgi:hypothetical protein